MSKLERLPETLSEYTKLGNPAESEAAGVENDDNFATSPPALVPHETFSKRWSIEAVLRARIPRRLLRHAMFENVVDLPSCRIVFGTEDGVMTVKGDNDQHVDKMIEKLDNLAKAIVRCSTLFEVSPMY